MLFSSKRWLCQACVNNNGAPRGAVVFSNWQYFRDDEAVSYADVELEVEEALALLLDELSLFLDSLLDSADDLSLPDDGLSLFDSLLDSDDDFEPLPLFDSPFWPLRA